MPLPHIIRGKELKGVQSPVLGSYFSMLFRQFDSSTPPASQNVAISFRSLSRHVDATVRPPILPAAYISPLKGVAEQYMRAQHIFFMDRLREIYVFNDVTVSYHKGSRSQTEHIMMHIVIRCNDDYHLFVDGLYSSTVRKSTAPLFPPTA